MHFLENQSSQNCKPEDVKRVVMDALKASSLLPSAQAGGSAGVKTSVRPVSYAAAVSSGPKVHVEELIAQNVNGDLNAEIKVAYKYPTKNKNLTSCVLEVSSEIQNLFFANSRIFLRYAACRFADHVWIPQCYKCLAFGHFAAKCNENARCGHCTGEHETRNCNERSKPPKCHNCAQNKRLASEDDAYSAMDAKKCPILCKKIKDRLTNINYG
ncbi:hypothetical protein X777_12262 [Ooceraea biroi]|uniref:CCHC-type domain-containing protein n=1 Tax=Ooceraea biroi TaxID=2015173 RepID=A0A026W3B0_OOCBI|nr:hypothetical protein X777_12262 [Ooceraea biroi]